MMRYFLIAALAGAGMALSISAAAFANDAAGSGYTRFERGSLYVPAKAYGVKSHDEIGVVSEAPHRAIDGMNAARRGYDIRHEAVPQGMPADAPGYAHGGATGPRVTTDPVRMPDYGQ